MNSFRIDFVCRSWVPVAQIFMLSEEAPSMVHKTKGAFEDSLNELKLHISKIE